MIGPASDLTTMGAHILGAHVISDDLGRGVTDPDLKVHGVAGLLALGGGALATSAPANPTLTIAARSLRAGARL